MTEVAERYHRRADRFERTVRGVQPDQWEDPSPCAEWTARGVLQHVLDMHRVVLRPVRDDAGDPPTALDDPLGAFLAARTAVEAVLADADLASTACDTPMGTTTVEQHVDQVASDDLVLHGWDLARATGQDETMDPADVRRLYDGNAALPPEVLEQFRTPGAFGPGIVVFGPEVPVPSDAPLQDRLLGMVGRHPH